MIATLTGRIDEKIGNQVVVSLAGVGYGALVTTNNLDRMSQGETVKLYIYENIKEDAHELLGFMSLDDKKLFEQLISVKNVGPRVAMNLMDIGSAGEVRIAIAGGDVKKLQTAKGVGKRAAEQIVVELRDKVGLLTTDSAEDIVTRAAINAQDEAVQALISLGYSDYDAALALKNVDLDLPAEQRIKLALKSR